MTAKQKRLTVGDSNALHMSFRFLWL